MMNNFKALKSGNLENVNPSMLFPLLRWCSGSVVDLKWCNEVNKNFFNIPPEIQKGLIHIGLKDKNPYMKYPKSTKLEENKIFELKKLLSMKYYFWSEQEFNRNIQNLDYINWAEILKALGCDSKDYKTLGIEEVKTKITKHPKEQKKKPLKTLFDF